jgi:hypothetical protein
VTDTLTTRPPPLCQCLSDYFAQLHNDIVFINFLKLLLESFSHTWLSKEFKNHLSVYFSDKFFYMRYILVLKPNKRISLCAEKKLTDNL